MQTKEEKAAYKKRWYEANKGRLVAVHKLYYQTNKASLSVHQHQYYEANKGKIIEKVRAYGKINRKIRSLRDNLRRQKDEEYRMVDNLRGCLGQFLKKNKRSSKMIELTGCTALELRAHIEKQFLPGMSWQNWSRNGWHIDHKIPIGLKDSKGLRVFDILKKPDQKFLFHYTNLQPLWAKKNQEKGFRLALSNEV